MYAPGQVVSQHDRRRAVDYACQVKKILEESGLAGSIAAILNREFQIQRSTPVGNGVPLIACRDIPVRELRMGEYSRKLAALLCKQVSEKFHNINCLVSDLNRSEELVARLAEITLKGSGERLAVFSRELGLELETLAFFSVYLARPIRSHVAKLVSDQGGLSDWNFGYCPACGLWARMGQIDAKEGHMHLWCIGCDLRWPFPRLCCPFCLERGPERMGFLRVDESDRFRVYTCDGCRRYLKTVVTSEGEVVEFDAEYLSSSQFDLTAAFEGYVQDFVGYAAFDLQDNAAARAYRQRALSSQDII